MNPTIWPMVLRGLLIVVFANLFAVGCVSFPDAPERIAAPNLTDRELTSVDGAKLGVMKAEASTPRAILIALHGMNDYSNAFADAVEHWAREADVTTYAIDQRGFGRSPDFGRWPGGETMRQDLRAAIEAARRRHPSLPVFVLGHSMGAAVVISAEAESKLDADGLILAAPGVWGGRAMPLLYRISLNVAATLAPGKTATGERAGKQASDNIEKLRAMYHDPLVIKDTRLDAALGVVRLMGEAYGSANDVDADILFLIGERDEIIPRKAMEKTAARLNGNVTVKRYPEGWHLLFRDLQAETVWRDVSAWLQDQLTGKGLHANIDDSSTGHKKAPQTEF